MQGAERPHRSKPARIPFFRTLLGLCAGRRRGWCLSSGCRARGVGGCCGRGPRRSLGVGASRCRCPRRSLRVGAGWSRRPRWSLRMNLANSGRKWPDFGPFPTGKKANEQRRFESSPLQQRRTANRCVLCVPPWRSRWSS